MYNFFCKKQIVNEKDGKYSGCMLWPGCEYHYNGVTSSHVGTYEEYGNKPWKERVNTALDWFVNVSKPATVVLIYFDDLRKVLLKHGPYSAQVTDTIDTIHSIVFKFANLRSIYIFRRIKGFSK